MKNNKEDQWFQEHLIYLKLRAQALEKELLDVMSRINELEVKRKYPKKYQ